MSVYVYVWTWMSVSMFTSKHECLCLSTLWTWMFASAIWACVIWEVCEWLQGSLNDLGGLQMIMNKDEQFDCEWLWTSNEHEWLWMIMNVEQT